MLSQRNGFLLRSLRVLIFQLLLTQFCRGQSQLIGPLEPIVAKMGDDIILPCYLKPAQDVFAMALEWTRSDLNSMFVYVSRDGQDLIHTKHPYYKDRTSLSTDELKHGNVSLKLSKVKLTDQGKYKCYIPKLETTSFVDLVVDDFTEVQFSYFAATVGLAVSLAICVLLIVVLLFFFLWKRRQNQTERVRDKTENGEKKNDSKSNKTEDASERDNEMEHLNKGKKKEKIKRKEKPEQLEEKKQLLEEQHSRKEAENKVKVLKEELETKKKELETKQTELQQLREEKQRNEDELQTLKDKLDSKNKELETIRATLAQYSKSLFWKKKKAEQEAEQESGQEAEQEVETLTNKLETQRMTLLNKTKEFEVKQAEVQQLQAEYQRMETNMQNKMLELESVKESELQNTLEVSQAQGSTSSACQDSATVFIVDKVDPDGEYVELRNTSHEDQQVGMGWELHVRVNNRKPVIMTFKASFVIRAEVSAQISMKQKSWNTGDRLLIDLYSDTGEMRLREMLEIGNSQIKFLELDTNSAGHDSATGHIIVDKIDPDRKYVRVRNISDKKKQMELWNLHMQVDNRKPIIIYTFDSSFKLNPGQTVTVYSKDSGFTPNPPTNPVSSESWSSGDQLLVTLYSDTGEEVSMKKVDNTTV